MRTFEEKTLLQSGNIFQEFPGEENPLYFVRDFIPQGMRVAELTGKNRDGLVVPHSEVPTPDLFKRWGFSHPVAGLREDYAAAVIKAIREALGDLKTAETHSMHATLHRPTPERGDRAFEAFQILPEEALFRNAVYRFGGTPGVTATLHGVDVNRLDVIPQEWIHRNGGVLSWDPQVNDIEVTQSHVEGIDRIIKEAGVLTWPDAHLGRGIFPQSQRDTGALSNLYAYLPNPEQTTRPRVFQSLEEARAAVMAVATRTSQTPR